MRRHESSGALSFERHVSVRGTPSGVCLQCTNCSNPPTLISLLCIAVSNTLYLSTSRISTYFLPCLLAIGTGHLFPASPLAVQFRSGPGTALRLTTASAHRDHKCYDMGIYGHYITPTGAPAAIVLTCRQTNIPNQVDGRLVWMVGTSVVPTRLNLPHN